MITPVDGFRRTTLQIAPELIEDCQRAVDAAERNLVVQREALEWILGVAHRAGVARPPQRERHTPPTTGAALVIVGPEETAA